MKATKQRYIPTSSISPNISTIKRFFVRNGIEAYLVGGAVRDACLNRDTEDLDVVVVSSGTDIGSKLATDLNGKYILLDPVRNIDRIVFPENKLTVDVTYLKNSKHLHNDLIERDFTIDAIAISLNQPESDITTRLIDPTDGYSDLENSLIKATSERAFQSDPIRILRGVRLSSQLGFMLENETEEWIKRNSSLLLNVSVERVRDELLKIISSENIASSLYKLDNLGLLSVIIPELENCKGVEQPGEHVYDVFKHSVETPNMLELILSDKGKNNRAVKLVPRFEQWEMFFQQTLADGASRLTLLKFAGLLHDIAKPQTKTVESNGRVRFLGHGYLGAETTQSIMNRLRFSRKASDYVSTIVKHHLRPSQLAPKDLMPSKKAVYRYYRDLGDVSIDTIYLNLSDYMAAKGDKILESDFDLSDWERHCKVAFTILDNKQKNDPDIYHRIVSGYDLMSALGLESGPVVGTLIDSISESYAAGEINTRKEAIDFARTLIKNENK
ncbi:MAG: poly(A) polymerase [Chloroflexi bacterium]|nr:MAG: poly(A) polymerase [Chloroflexota bacterium]